MSFYAIFGNPINHSLSPTIYSIFSKKTNLFFPYYRVESPIKYFEEFIQNFFYLGGLGANITIPFKERAFSICNHVTHRSYLTQTVNVIKKLPNGSLLGDNTDGIGLINDFHRFNLLNNKQYKKILLIGAGGAARGILPFLLLYRFKITITNRTFDRAKKLAIILNNIANIAVYPMNKINNPEYDIIINATSSSMYRDIPDLSPKIITPRVFCYDIFYQNNNTSFINWARKHGALYYSDGLGMLVNQAAFSFLLWHGIMPPVLSVIKDLKKN